MRVSVTSIPAIWLLVDGKGAPAGGTKASGDDKRMWGTRPNDCKDLNFFLQK